MKTIALQLALRAISIFLMTGLLVVSWILFTPSGSSASLNILQNRFNDLDYTYKSGTLASGLQFDQVTWHLKNKTLVTAHDLQFLWNPRCWRSKQLCISQLKTKRVVIDVATNPDSSGDTKTLSSVDLPISIIADSLQVQEIIINNVNETPLIFNDLDFTGTLEGSDLVAEKLQLDWLWLQINASGKMQMVENYPLTLDGTVNSTDLKLTLPINSNWQVGGDLLSMLLKADFSAPYNGQLNGTYSMLRKGLPANVKINWATAPWPRLDNDPQVFVDNGEFVISGPGPDYKTSATANIHGVSIPPAAIALDGKINTRKATFFPMVFDTLGGKLKTQGVFKWHNGLSWSTSLEATELWPDLFWPQVQGLVNGTAHFDGRTHNGQTRLNLKSINSDGTLFGHRFQLTGDALKDPYGVWHLSSIEAVNKGNRINANGAIGVNSDLKLFFSSESLDKFVTDMTGEVHGDLLISGDLASPEITGTVSSAQLNYKGIELRNVKSQGILRGFGKSQSEIKTIAESVTANSQTFGQTRVDFTGSWSDHVAQIAFKHKFVNARRLWLQGGIKDGFNWQGQVNEARGRFSGHSIALKKPFNLRWIHDRQSFVLQPHCWKLQLAEGCVTQSTTLGADGLINFSINQLDLENLQTLQSRPLALTGVLNSNGNLRWGKNIDPSVTIAGEISGAAASWADANNREKINLALDQVKVKVATKESLIKADLQIKAQHFGALKMLVDIDTSSPGLPISGSLALAGSNIKWLRSYLPDTTKLEGQISADGVIGGSLTAPLIDGVLSVSEAAVSSPVLPVDLDDIALDIAFDNEGTEISGLARSGDTPVHITGHSAQQGLGWSTRLNVRADKLKVNTDYFRRAEISPNLDIAITDKGMSITGNVAIPRANIVVNDLGAGGIAMSGDVTIVDASDDQKRRAAPVRQNFSSEIEISLGDRVRFNGYGLKADLSGDFQLVLDAQRPPELLGEIMVDNGTYRSYGQNLLIRDGRITFVGPLEQTAVKVEAIREVDNILAGLRVDGSLQDPTTTLFSEPTLPEEEILSYVVLGRSLEFGSSDDSHMLTNAALFMGISNGRSFSQNIAENLGIEDFYLTASGTGNDTQVMLSGRLNNRLLVRYGVGVFNAVSTLFLRYDLAEQLYVETTQGLEKAIDIFYSFEF